MGLREARAWARRNGYDGVEELTLKDGSTAYALITEATVGLPRYVRDVGGVFVLSTEEESLALLEERMHGGDDG